MPRTYKRVKGRKSRAPINVQNMLKAINSVKNEGMKISVAATKYNVRRTSLSKRLQNPSMKDKPGATPALPSVFEENIVQKLIILTEWGYPLSSKEVRHIIGEYLKQCHITIPRFTNNMPGPDYLCGFFNRHKDKLTIRLCSNIKRSRAAVDRNCLKSYFDHLSESLAGIPKEKIYNYDETNFTDDPGKKKVLAKRTAKYVERIMNSSKSATSAMFIANAAGFVLPPYVVYKATNMYTSWTERGPTGCRYNRSKSGWFDSDSFLDWLKTIVIPHLRRVEGKKFLIGDNLSTHISLEAIQLCEQYDIHFIFLPPNSTHLLQPLDVAVYSSLKINWRAVLTQWKQTDGQMESSVPKHTFPLLLNRLMDKVKDKIGDNVISGFRKCGICPLDFGQMMSRFPQSIQNQPEENDNPDVSMDNVFIRFLQALRPKQQEVRQKKKQIKIEPGKSISAEDLPQINDQAGPSGLQAPPKKRGRPKSAQSAVDDQEAGPPKKRGRPKLTPSAVDDQEAGPSGLQAPRKSNRVRRQQAQTTWQFTSSESESDFYASDDEDSDFFLYELR